MQLAGMRRGHISISPPHFEQHGEQLPLKATMPVLVVVGP